MRFTQRFALLLILLAAACSPAAQPASAPAPVQTTPSVVEPLALVQPALAEVEPAPRPQPVAYRGFTFTIDEALAAFARGEAVSAEIGSANRLDTPEHVRFTFDDLIPSAPFDPLDPQLLIFPARAYSNISPAAGEQIAALQALIAGSEEEGDLPLLPLSAGGELLQARARRLTFQGGSGARYVARYISTEGGPDPGRFFYTFQALSSDGAYYIAFFYPVEIGAALPAPEPLDLEGYRREAASFLNELPASAFEPSLDALDALVGSLGVPEPVQGLVQTQPPRALLEMLLSRGLPALQSLWDTLEIGRQDIFSPDAEIGAELFDLDVNGSEDEYQVLVVSDRARQNWQYLVFRSVGLRWWFSGRINLPFQAYVPPGFRVEGDGTDAWLVVDWLEESGPGVTRYQEGWFLLSRGRLEQALGYPVEGFRVSVEAAYNVCFLSSPEVLREPGLAVSLPYSITYSIYGDGKERTNPSETYDLFSMQRGALYRWDPGAGAFRLDAEGSTLSEEQIAAGFYFASPGGGLVDFAGNELSLLARSGGSLQRRWLKGFLGGLEDTPAVEELRKAIGG